MLVSGRGRIKTHSANCPWPVFLVPYMAGGNVLVDMKDRFKEIL